MATTGNAWGGASEIITLKSGDLRRRNELADRAKHLRILQNYGLQPPESKSGKTGGDRDGGDYDDDGFEGEVSHRITLPHIIAYQLCTGCNRAKAPHCFAPSSVYKQFAGGVFRDIIENKRLQNLQGNKAVTRVSGSEPLTTACLQLILHTTC